MTVSSLHLIFMLFAIVIVFGGGLWAARSIRSAESFSVGGRAASAPLVTGALAGTAIGGGATVGTAQLAYSIGIAAWWFTIGTGLTMLFLGLFYARPLRQSALVTVSEFLSRHYGSAATILVSLASSLGTFFSIVASVLPGIGIISSVFSISSYAADLLLTLLVSCYIFFGGMKSASVSGILKMLVIYPSLLIAGFLAYQGIGEISLVPEGAFDLFSIGYGNVLTNLLSLLVGMLTGQAYIQAMFSASTPRAASFGAILAAIIVIPVGLPSTMIGIYMHVAEPDITPILVLPTYLLEHLSPTLGGLAMGGILLALISSLGGLTLGISTMVSHDVLARLFSVTKSHTLLRLNRLVVLFVLASAGLFSIANEGSEILFWNYLSMALRGCGIFLPLTLAILLPHRISPRLCLLGMLFATTGALLATFVDLGIAPIHLGISLSIFFMILGYLSQRLHDEK